MDCDVLILGCGPAGLMAAYAVAQLGGSPHIVALGYQSQFAGAQYLHEPIPDITGEPDGVIRTYRQGTREGYAQKVYGDPNAPCSWDLQEEEKPAWDLRRAYQQLWDRYSARIFDLRITRAEIGAWEADPQWKLVLSSIPATQLCYRKAEDLTSGGDHVHEWESMYTIDYAPPEVVDNTVLYSGAPEHTWYRASRVFGYASTEWTDNSPRAGAYLTPESDPPPKLFSLKKGVKVKGTNCDCFPGVKRIGRFGTWQKGYLTHHAYADAVRYFNEAFGG
jgi:hypothetical protein